MSLTEAFRLAVEGFWSNKLRTCLTMLGMLIGIASVILLLAVGNGSEQTIQNSINSLGSNLLTVFPSSPITGGVSLGFGGARTRSPWPT